MHNSFLNTCSCHLGFKGPDCSLKELCPQLKNCNNNGVCTKNATEYYCYGGYKGSECQIIQCDQVGDCSAHGECDFGYTGKYCNETTCESLNFCSFNGQCNSEQKCI